MKHLFQVVRPLDGYRSEPVACTAESLAATLLERMDVDADLQNALVLVVLENVESSDSFVSVTPLYRVDSFIRHFGKKEVA